MKPAYLGAQMKDYLMGTKFRQGRGDASRDRWPRLCLSLLPPERLIAQASTQPSHVPAILAIADKFPAAMTPSYPSVPPLCVQGPEGREGSALRDLAPVEGFPSKEHDLRLCAEDTGLCRHWQSVPVLTVRHSN